MSKAHFPTAPLILGTAGIRSAYAARVDHDAQPRPRRGRPGERRSIVLTAIPYQVGKNGLVEKIAEAAKDKRIEGVSDIRDRSSWGVRIVIELKRDATAEVVLNNCGVTLARSSFPANMRRSVAGGPRHSRCAASSRASSSFARRSSPAVPSSSCSRRARRAHLARPGRRGHPSRRGCEDDPRLGEPGCGANCSSASGMPTRSGPTSSWSKRSRRRPPGSPIACPKRR